MKNSRRLHSDEGDVRPATHRHGKNSKGRVVEVNGQIAVIEFTSNALPALHDVLIIDDGKNNDAMLEVVLSKTSSTFYCLILRGALTLKRGTIVTNTHEQLMIPVGPPVLGRAFDVFADAHDEGDQDVLNKADRRGLFEPPNTTLSNVQTSQTVMETGIKPIDFFTPLLQGGKTALIGGAGIGKTVILTELVNRMVVQKKQENMVAVFSAVGERSREAQELYENFTKAKVLPFTSLILGQMGENPAVRWRTAYAGATLAEHFREDYEKDVLFFMDNIYRFAQAGHELSMLMNSIPSEDGYQSTLPSEMAALQERLISTDRGSVTSFMALFVPSDDLTDHAVRSIFPYLDTMIILSREVFQSGRFPAIDLLSSTSAAMTPLVIGLKHYSTYIQAKQVLEESANLERIVSLVGEDELSPDNQSIYMRSKLIINYMAQDLFVSEEETGHEAEFVPLSETVEAMSDILDGKYDNLDPEDLRYIGSIKNLDKRLAEKKKESENKQEKETAASLAAATKKG